MTTRLRHFPKLTVALVVINVLVWALGLLPAAPDAGPPANRVDRNDVWFIEYGAIPCELVGRCANQRGTASTSGTFDMSPATVRVTVPARPPVLTLFTSLFLHGGFVHLAFNMLFLWVYGRVIEDAMHPLAFLAFFLLAGVVATLGQALAASGAGSPIIGASGAIAGLIGGFLALYPRTKVLTAPWFMWIAAMVWALLEFLTTWRGLLAPGALDGGIAYVAHIVGLVFGFLAVRWFADRRNDAYDDEETDGYGDAPAT